MDTEASRHSHTYSPELLRAAEQLLEVVGPLRRLISAAGRTDDASGTLTMTQLRLLGLLVQRHQLPSELARRLEITPATASEIVDLLVRRGLVERCDQPADRRCTPLQTTPTGLSQWKAARERSLEALRELLSGLESSELSALERGLEALLALVHGRALAGGGSEHAD